jgi:hypothetical protein
MRKNQFFSNEEKSNRRLLSYYQKSFQSEVSIGRWGKECVLAHPNLIHRPSTRLRYGFDLQIHN